METIIDYSPLFNELINQNTQLIEQNNLLKEDIKFMRDYLEITEEEQKILDKQQQEINEQKKLDLENQRQFLIDNFTPTDNEEIKTELIKVNDNLTSGIEVNKYQINQDYILLIGLLLVFVSAFIYYIIKKFIY